jgi:DNA-binding transcriptional ArsR family regulator
MPVLDQDLIRTTQTVSITFALKPVPNMLNSLCLLNKVDKLLGLDAWVTQTVATLSTEQLRTNGVVCEGLHYAIQPVRPWSSFPLYLDGLATEDPLVLRDRVFEVYARMTHTVAQKKGESALIPDQADLLANLDLFLDYLQRTFYCVDPVIETEAHRLLNDPPLMQQVIVSHLRPMWSQYLQAEWGEVAPSLQESVKAWQQLDFSGQTAVEIVRTVIGNELNEEWEEYIAAAKEIVFVPSAHLGPYAGKFLYEGGFGIFFGARLPEGTQVYSPTLSRSELLVRLGALTDDTRLYILKFLADHDEQCAQEIMNQLELSQSAASRHLRQLSAAGYITERRREGGKCYKLKPDRFGDTFRALERYLGLS